MATPPNYADIAKTSNDLLNKDFYHLTAASIEVKSKAPNGVSFNVKGKSAHEGPISGSLEGKYTDAPTGKSPSLRHRPPGAKQNPQPKPPPAFLSSVTLSKRASKDFLISYQYTPSSQLDRVTLIYFPLRKTGLTLTQSWTTANSLDTKVELDNSFTKGLKAEVLTNYLPTTQAKGAKLNLYFKQPNFHGRAFFDLLKGPTANVDAVLGHEGFLVGAEAGYDVQKAAITRYSAAIGYSAPEYTAAITATNSLSIFSASYYQRVNSQTEVGAKATWDSKAGSNVGLELASKYILDPSSFAKAKINDRGIAALAYNIKLRPGVTLGLGASLDTQQPNESAHKVGASFTFES